jgi:hypothetical protein
MALYSMHIRIIQVSIKHKGIFIFLRCPEVSEQRLGFNQQLFYLIVSLILAFPNSQDIVKSSLDEIAINKTLIKKQVMIRDGNFIEIAPSCTSQPTCRHSVQLAGHHP